MSIPPGHTQAANGRVLVLRALSGAALVAAAAACSDAGPTHPLDADHSRFGAVEVSGMMVAGRSQALRVSYWDDTSYEGFRPSGIRWTSTDAKVLAVRHDGTVAALKPGRAMLIAASSARSDTAIVEVVAKGYQVTPVGGLGGAFSEALDVNDAGIVVGNASTGAGDTVAFIWHGGAPSQLGSFHFPRSWGALGEWLAGGSALIDAQGRVVGTPELPGPAGAVVTAVSDAGQVAGYWPGSIRGGPADSAFVVIGGRVTRLTQTTTCEVLPGPVPTSRNDSGQVAGWLYYGRRCSGGQGQAGAFWSSPAALSVYDAAYMSAPAAATAINSTGEHVYWRACHACIRNNGVEGWVQLAAGATMLRPLALAGVVYPLDLNDAAQVVGRAEAPSDSTAEHHGFLWRSGAMGDLTALVTDTDWVILTAAGINESGQIAATARNRRTGWSGAVLLTPLR
jgi:probable HAF family extracellular repeat protein